MLVCLIGSMVFAHPGDDSPIQTIRLDDRVVVLVPVATNRITTISFPGPIAAIDSVGVTADPKVPAHFQLAHTKGSSFLSVRALTRKAATNLNIRWDKRTYVFELFESDNPVLSLNMAGASGEPAFPPAALVSPTRLLSLLDKAKAFPLLKEQHPESVAGVDVRTYTGTTNVTDFNDFQIQLEEAYRFNYEDTLVFRATLRNRADTPLAYRPDSFAIRVGNRLYPQSISDASGLLPPHGESTVYFAVTGTPDGGRNELSLKNDFSVLVIRTSPPPLAPPSNPAPAVGDNSLR